MEFLYLLESIRTPLLDQFFSLITHLGSEIVFMALSIIMYWCVSKSRGLYLLSVGCVGTTINQFLKMTFCIPRPWVRDPGFTVVEGAVSDAGGYSFPSGHTQNVVGTFGCLAMDIRKNWVRVVLLVLAALTGFSRMYLGVHTLADVLVSVVIAAVLVVAMHPLFKDLEEHPYRGMWLLGGLFLLNLVYVIYANLWLLPTTTDRVNLLHGVESASKVMGALVGMAIGYGFDLTWVKFDTKATLPGQILKCVLGLIIVIGIKEGMKPVLGTGMSASAVRYGLVTMFAAGIWPMSFPFFANIGRKKA